MTPLPTGDPHIHPTVYLLSKQTGYTASQYKRGKMDGGEDMKQGGWWWRGGENVNTGLDCKGESSTISNLEDLKNE